MMFLYMFITLNHLAHSIIMHLSLCPSITVTVKKFAQLSADNMIMQTGNDNIRVHFGIVILLFIQQVAIHWQLLVCGRKAKAGILFGKDVFSQLGCWQNYTNTIVYIKQVSIQLILQKRNNNTTKHDYTSNTTTPKKWKHNFKYILTPMARIWFLLILLMGTVLFTSL